MKIRNLTKILLFITVFALVLPLAACGNGALKLESFTVDRSSVKTAYLVGEEIDFSGIKATAKYSDETLNKVYTYNELTITYADDITATAGNKEVTVSFDDPHLNVKQETKVTITVTEEGGETPAEPLVAVQFEKPQGLTQFASTNASAGTLKYGDAGFFGEFAVGGKTYVIGNQNAFKLNPRFAVLSEDGESVEELAQFFAVVEIAVEKDGAYVALTKTAGEGNSVTYSDGETLIATVDTYKGTYQFSADAAGMKVKISVLPSDEYYIASTPFNAVTLEANVVEAYNVYDAFELSLIDNYNEAWNDFRTQHGIAGIAVSGIVLHANLKLTADDMPASYFYTTEKEVVYTNTVSGETVTVPAGTKYLQDSLNVYDRHSAEDFMIEGNFFTIDLKEVPLVPSPAVFGADADRDYGSDFSNTSLFRFKTSTWGDLTTNTVLEDVAKVNVNNLAIVGNAKRDNLVDANENLASAGGLIFFKSSYLSQVKMDNIVGNSFFITYFAECGDMEISNVKCSDSYQNAAFVYGRSNVSIADSYLEGCGGPVIINSSVINHEFYPSTTTTNTMIVTHVTGEEIWFTAVGANSLVGSIKGLGMGLAQAGFGNIVDANGKMNIKGLLMAEGSNAAEIVTGIDAQGAIFFDKHGISRFATEDNLIWAAIKQISAGAQMMGAQMPPFFTVQDAEGNTHTIYFNGQTFVDLQGRALGTDASHMALAAAFTTADTIVLTQGGLSVVFEMYHN